jgi:uncharacterized C2H2 Zn-finger protein
MPQYLNCEQCPKRYIRKCDLDRHVAKKHLVLPIAEKLVVSRQQPEISNRTTLDFKLDYEHR